MVLVRVSAPGSERELITYALLDTGSTTSFCSERVLNDLGLSGTMEDLSLSTLERSKSSSQCRVAQLVVRDLDKTRPSDVG